ADGFIAVGDAAGHVNPTTGGGISTAAFAGQYAGEKAVEAIEEGDVSEESLWGYNVDVMDEFGARYATLDVYNIFVTAYDTDEIISLLSSLPGDKISEALYEGKTSIPLTLKLRMAVSSFGHWDTVYSFYKAKKSAEKVLDHYEEYPESRDGFEDWQEERDRLLDDVYETTGAEPKYS
ncbi:MAG: electron transfer flavoprotein, partial [Halobacteria archaeon]|nr:electron transfer flavoprotein [Halobacteria archaeon]